MDLSAPHRHIIRDPNNRSDTSKHPERKTRQEIIAEQLRVIKNWKPKNDVWPLTTGRSILISLSTITGIYINHRFRMALKLRSYGTVPTMIGLTVMPAALTSIAHTEFILNKLLLLEIPCPLCMESKAALAQTCSGLLMPMILAPLANFSITAGSGVYNVPYATDVRKIFSTIFSVYQPMMPKIALIFTVHALLAGFITYLEIKSFLRILDLQYLIEETKEEQKLK